MSLNPTEPLKELVKVAGEKHPTLCGKTGTLARVNPVLRIYASTINRKPGELTWLDVVGSDLGIHPKLLACINDLPRPERRPAERHGDYKSEFRSNLNKIIHEVADFYSGESAQKTEDPTCKPFAFKSLPKILQELWPHLPRESGNGRRSSLEVRARLPLSECGQSLLKVLLASVNQHNIKSLEELFVTRSKDVYAQVRKLVPPARWHRISECFRELRARMNFSKRRRARCIDVKDFPSPLREQWREYERKSRHGLGRYAELERLASAYDVSVNPEPHKASTVRTYLIAFRVGIFQIIEHLKKSLPEGEQISLDIRDLIRLEPVERALSDGKSKTDNANRLVDVYRATERQADREGQGKGVNRDSRTFSNFINAVKAVAAYDGVFEGYKEFSEAYTIRLDKKAARAKQTLKKETLDRPWVDRQIERLGAEFYRIVEERSFVRDASTRKALDTTMSNMRLCLFYVVLVTLRYAGFRQQAIRSCAIGQNIVFGENGSVSFYYRQNEVKNEVGIRIPLRRVRDKDKDTHGVLRRALVTYYTEVYPYIRANAEGDLEGQFFVKLRQNGKFIPHQREAPAAGDEDNSTTAAVYFGEYFRGACRSFLVFEDRAGQLPTLMNPHFLRGLCADWLHYDLGVAVEKIADYLGDTVQIIVAKYLRKKTLKDGGAAIAEAGENQKARRHEERGDEDEAAERARERQRSAETASLRGQVSALLSQLEQANARADRAESRGASLEAKIEKLEGIISELREERDKDRQELLDSLKARAGNGGSPARNSKATKDRNGDERKHSRRKAGLGEGEPPPRAGPSRKTLNHQEDHPHLQDRSDPDRAG